MELGISLNYKLECPSTCLTILGIELDSDKLQAWLSRLALFRCWIPGLQNINFQQAQGDGITNNSDSSSHHAPQGWTFLCQMIDLLCALHREDHPIQLNQEF